MSKIGRKPIEIGGAQIEIKDREIHYKGKKASGVYVLDKGLSAELKGKELYITPKAVTPDTNRLWGLHRALLANKIKGADTGFEKQLRIVGLGFKAALAGSKMQFSLGYSHKIDMELPKDVAVEIDKTGQLLTFRSFDKDLLGQVCSDVRALRPPEPYKGTGIQYVNEVIIRKAGKAKS
jgi:large subunit ribosomal protein L6